MDSPKTNTTSKIMTADLTAPIIIKKSVINNIDFLPYSEKGKAFC